MNINYAYDERVPLADVDLYFIHGESLMVDRVDLNDGHGVVVDAELPVGVARDGDKTEAIAIRTSASQ